MAEIKLTATTGRELGNGPSRRIRAEGKVPGVVYGLDADPIPVTVEWRPLRAALTTDAGLNALINLDVDGDVALTIIKEMQRHPIRGDVMHLDFLRVSADALISVEVPINMVGEAEAVDLEDGTVDHLLFNLTINAKPADIPNEILVDISDLKIGDAIRVEDLDLPAGVTTDVDGDDVVITALAPTVEEPEPTDEAAVGEAAAGEGEKAEGEAKDGEAG